MEMEQQNRYRKDQNQKNELQRRLEQEKKLERNVDGHEKALEEEKKKHTKESTIGKFRKCAISKFDKQPWISSGSTNNLPPKRNYLTEFFITPCLQVN